MIWIETKEIFTDWPGGPVRPRDILYEIDGPVFFVTTVGFADYFFFKKDELEESDFFITCFADPNEIQALKEGRLSIRGALNKHSGWIVELNLLGQVLRYQQITSNELQHLLPPAGLGLYSQFGVLPDSLSQANALMAFKFYSEAMNDRSMPLRLLTDTVDKVSKFVRNVLTPASLLEGRNGRFFDVAVGQPVFASLLISINAPTIDRRGLRNNKSTSRLASADLESASIERGLETWTTIQEALRSYAPMSSVQFDAGDHREFLDNVANLVPSEDNELEKLEISFRTEKGTELVTIDRATGEKFVKARNSLDGKIVSIEGVITEVNGESFTFLLRDNSHWVTTCHPSTNLFRELDDGGHMNRGQRIKVTGRYWRRTRRGYLSFDTYPEILRNLAQ